MPCLLSALLDVSPEAAGGGIAATVAGLITIVAALLKWWENRKTARKWRSIGPVAPMPEPPPHPGHGPLPLAPPVPPELLERIANLERNDQRMAEWDLNDCRQRVRELQRAHEEAADELARTQHALAEERATNDRLRNSNRELLREQSRLEHRVEQLRRSLSAATVRLAQHETGAIHTSPTQPPRRR